MNIEELKNKISSKLSNRDYYGMLEILTDATNEYLNGKSSDYQLCLELIRQNQDLFEYLGASKQFESDFALSQQVRINRNRLFVSCLDGKDELKSLFKRAVGDFS